MIKLFEKDEQSFTSLGLGVLTDCTTCEITNELNGTYEASFEYPMTGIHFDDLKEDRIIVCKPDRYSDEQPFRIYSISKPLNKKVRVKAAHISYDQNYYPVGEISGNSLNDTLSKIKSSSYIKNPFKFYNQTSEDITKAFSSTKVRSIRSLLYQKSSNDEESILSLYECDIVPDKFNVYFYPKGTLGSNNGVTFRYGKNLTDLTQDTDASTKVTGIFPIYSKESKERGEVPKVYEKAYVRSGQTPVLNNILQVGWVTYTDNIPDGAVTFIDTNTISGLFQPFQLIATANHPLPQGYEYLNGHYIKFDVTNGLVDVTDHIDDYPPIVPSTSIDYGQTVYTNITLREVNAQGQVIDNGVVYVKHGEEQALQKILIVDLSNKFETDPSKEELRAEAKKYIEDNKLGESTVSVKASFVLLSSSSEFHQFINAERINLGDTITVIYEALGVSDTLRIESIVYDCVKDNYVKMGLGQRQALITDRILKKNDKLSYLRNDKGFLNQPKVADAIKDGVNNTEGFSEEQIVTLSLGKYNCPGIIEASSDAIDQIVAKLLVADYAYIKNKLVAGEIVVNGTITAQDGVFYGTISVGGDKQSRIDSLYAADISSSNIKSGSVDSNTVKTGKLTLVGYQGVLQTITVNDYTYYRDVSLDESGYYGWTSIEHATPETLNQLVTTVTVPFDGTATYYKDTKSFYDLVDFYNPYGYTLDTNTDLVVESLAGGSSTTITFSAGVTATRNTAGKTIDCVATVTASNQVPENTNVRVTFSVRCVDDTGTTVNTYNEIAICTLQAAGAVTSNATIKIPNPNNTMYPLTPTITLVTPTSKEYTVEDSGTSIVSIDNNFGPKVNNKYSLGRGGRLWSDVYAANSTIQTSDERTKKDISYDVSKYDQLFDKLKPVSFKFKEGESGRTHLGLIAQDLKQAMDECDISTQDFAGYVKYLGDESIKEPVEEDYSYAIRYGEFISLCIHKIQQLEARIKELENKEGS